MNKDSVFPTGIAVGGGITKREYLSAQIIHGMLAGTYADIYQLDNDAAKEFRKKTVKSALAYADALLEALDKPVKSE